MKITVIITNYLTFSNLPVKMLVCKNHNMFSSVKIVINKVEGLELQICLKNDLLY